MDLEPLKTIFSAFSLLVSAGALATSLHTKWKTEKEGFEDKKSQAATLLRKNEVDAEALSLEATRRRSEIARLADMKPNLERDNLLQHLRDIRGVDLKRPYTGDEILALANTEANRAKVRDLVNREQAIATELSHSMYKMLLDEAEQMVGELKKRRNPTERDG
jgi:hypothetical protein